MENRKHSLRSLLFYSGITMAVVAIGVFLLQEPSLAQATAQTASGGGTGLLIARIFQVILGILLVVCLGFLVYGVFLLSSAEGDEIQEARGKRLAQNAGIFLAIFVILFGILTFAISRLQRGGGASVPTPSTQVGGGSFGAFPANLLEAHYPENGQRNLSRNTSIMVTFTEAMDLDTIINNNGTPNIPDDDTVNVNNIRIFQSSDDPIAGPFVSARAQVTDDLRTFLFTPISLLGSEQQNTNYTVIIGENVASEDGLSTFAELGEFTWEFEVGTFVDSDPPFVESVVPQDQSTHPRNVVVQINFNEAMNPLTVIGSIARGFDNISIRDSSGELVEGRFTISNQYRTVEFITEDFCGTNACGEDVFCLPGNQTFQAEIRAAAVSAQPPTALFPFDGVTDAASNSLDGNLDGAAVGAPDDNFAWSFQTTDQVDLTPPIITSVTPGPFDTNVSLQSPLTATFSKPLQFSSMTHQSVQVTNLDRFQISGKTTGNQSTITIEHGGLSEDTTYTPAITSDLRDLYQNCYRPCIGP